MTNLDSVLNQKHHFADKGLSSQNYGISSSHVGMWELDYKESWVLKNWCFQTVVLEKTLKRPLDSKEIKPVNPKGNLVLHWKDWCWRRSSSTLAIECKEPTHWKRPWCWKSLRQEEKRVTEVEIVGWHHQLNGHVFEHTPWHSEGQGSLACCIPWGCKQLNMTKPLNSNNSEPVKFETR